jgi:hypothetical protein
MEVAMLKLTRTGIGLLTAQYRSVLRKCWAINVGLFALGATTLAVSTLAPTDAYSADAIYDNINVDSLTLKNGTKSRKLSLDSLGNFEIGVGQDAMMPGEQPATLSNNGITFSYKDTFPGSLEGGFEPAVGVAYTYSLGIGGLTLANTRVRSIVADSIISPGPSTGSTTALATTRTLAKSLNSALSGYVTNSTLSNNYVQNTYVKIKSTGTAASATGTDAIAIGSNANANYSYATALGQNTSSTRTTDNSIFTP